MDFRVIWSSLANLTVKFAVGLGFIVVSANTQAAGLSDPEKNDGLIEIEYPVDALLPYRDRRPKNQFTFHVQYENFAPSGYLTQELGTLYSETYKNADAPLISGAIGWKHNLSFLGVEAAAFVGNGSIVDTQNGETLTLDFTKYGMKFAAYADTLFKEPYVVPYAAFQVVAWSISETSNDANALPYDHSTGIGTGVQLGLLFQLNWLEKQSSLVALNEAGLTNTYLDVFVQQYGDTSGDGDPSLASEFNWGAGFRMEY